MAAKARVISAPMVSSVFAASPSPWESAWKKGSPLTAIRPAVFYPYHYGEVEEKTDTARLVRELEGVTEVRIRPME